MKDNVIISLADANYFDLLNELIDSIKRFEESKKVSICIMDAGLQKNQIEILEKKVDQIKKAELYIKVPHFKVKGKEWLKRLENILATSKSIRTMGSAALETAYVSAGRIDAFISPAMQLRIFDCLPSIFIAKTAGASIKFFEPNLDDINFFKTKKIGYCVAANEDLLEDINNHI